MPASDELNYFIILKPSFNDISNEIRFACRIGGPLFNFSFMTVLVLLLLLYALVLVVSLIVQPISNVICLKAEVCSSCFNSIEFLL